MRQKSFLAAFLLLFCTTSLWASDTSVDGIWYVFNHTSMTATVTYRGSFYNSYLNEYSGSVVIPETVAYNDKTYSVTSIGEEAFSGCNSLKSVTIPNSVTSIGESAFAYCSSLTSIIIPNSVTSIENQAFYGCSSLPVVDNIRYADTYLVEAVDNALSTYHIKEGTRFIGNRAFYGCSSLTSIEIPNSVTNIGNNAFYNCNSLPVIDNIRYAHTYLIEVVDKSLASFRVQEGTKWIGDVAFSHCYNLTSVNIPNSVTSIGSSAFYGCSGLTSVIIPNSVTNIGDYAFYGCSSLTSMAIPNGVKGIEQYAFYNCSSLNSVTIPNSVTSIEQYAFYNCSNLNSVTIPNSVTSIGQYAFYNCSGLTSVTIGNGVTSIGEYAFSDCSSLTSVTIGKSVSFIGSLVFNGCSNLNSVVWNAKNCGDFGYYQTPFRYFYNDNKFDIGFQITSFIFGDDVEHIPAYLCYNMTSLPSINIPHSVTSVGNNAFYYCKCPLYVECDDLERMKQLLSDYANYVQNEPAPIYNLSTKATNGNIYTTKTKFTVCEEPFVTCTATANRGYQFVKWADGNTENPRTIELTQDTIMEALFEIATSGKCGRDNALVWKYDTITKALTITGNGTLDANYTYGTFIESVTIGNGVTIIGSEAFYNCSKLTSITIPNSVTSIGSYAFYGCSSLVTATIGNGVTTINKQAFYNCSNLETVSLGGSIETIGSKAFYNCTRIIDIYCYAERVPEASSDAFDGVSRKAYLWVPANRVRNYKTHELWGQFDVQAIEADGVNTSTVNIVPSDNTVKIIWPAVENADTYEITIYDQNGNIVCQLVFDSEGLLQSIAFGAPGRDNAPEATQATGFRFEVSSLTPGTTYNYTIVTKDATETVIDTREGSFTTTGTTAVENIATNTVSLQKVLRNGQLFILLPDGSRYTATGVKVE